MAISFIPADRHLHGGRLEMPDPRYGAFKGALLYAIRFDPVGKTSRETANQERTYTEAPRQHAAQLPVCLGQLNSVHFRFCSSSMKCLKWPLTRSSENWCINPVKNGAAGGDVTDSSSVRHAQVTQPPLPWPGNSIL
jgi:hypothetical protein